MLKYEEGRVLITAHRGVSGANIPCNTKAAFDVAIAQGADIAELDVTKSKDGELFVFHPGLESVHLKTDCSLSELTAKEIKGLRYVNQDDVITSYGVTPLEEMLLFLKDRIYVNIDKYWQNIEEITAVVRKTGMENRVIVKVPGEKKYADIMQRCGAELPVMSVLKDNDEFSEYALEKGINYIGAEVFFSSDDDLLVSSEYINRMHEKKLMIYGNAILFNEAVRLSAGHTDDRALTGDPEGGWGFFLSRKFDIIQTDWPMLMRKYIEDRAARQEKIRALTHC